MALVWPDLTALKHWLKVGIFPSRWITLTLLHWMWIGILTFEFWPNFGSVMAEFGVTFRVLVQFWSNFGPNLVTFGSNFCHILHFFYFCYIFIDLSNFGPIFYYEFRPNLGPFWPIFGQILSQFLTTFLLNFPHCPILAQFVPILVTNFSRILSQFLATFLSNFGPIFWLPSCQIFLEFWLHFGPIFGYILVKFSPNFVRKLVTISSKIPNPASSQSQLQRSAKKWINNEFFYQLNRFHFNW